MSRPLLFDISEVDLDHVAYGPEEIRSINPQRLDMQQLDGVIELDLEKKRIIGYKQARDDEFWVAGHIPGRPLLPGALIVEAVAQLCSFLYKKAIPDESRFLGFSGMDNVRFRGMVVPGDRLLLLAVCEDLRPRRAIFRAQGVVGEKVVFEGIIIGMPV